MAKPCASYCFLLVLIVFFSVRRVSGNVCRLTSITGGCPDEHECSLTCSTCYRNVGTVSSYCESIGTPVPVIQCVCVMANGAPCSPPGEPKCPNWPRSPPISSTGNYTN
uniref:uncharacterized protein LOC105351107 n=1 Tax=Fragaria vesca subsp. vesca TaxID=101020 RepID=UPI0005C7F5C1|nr:PREDICTED: uncharacterized protein LOC105351107 [Fragaria vesca subsp. vesca]